MRQLKDYQEIKIRELLTEGYPVKYIAEVALCCPVAVYARLKQLFPDRIQRPRWTDDEDKTLIKMWNDGHSYKAIADTIGRKKSSIDSRLHTLRKKCYNLIEHSAHNRNKNGIKQVSE